MRLSLHQDIALNVALPILAGSFIYLMGQPIGFLEVVYNYLPDGLWAYALLSTILIIWKRSIDVIWIAMVFILFIVFETLQYYHVVQGTGDFWDIFTYSLFSFISLISNKYFTAIKQ